MTFSMTYSALHGSSSSRTSASSSGSTAMGRMYSQFNPILVSNNPQKLINKLGIFQYEVYTDATPWHVPSPLNLAPATAPLPKFKDNLSKFSGNGVTTANEHLSAFYNACVNIGAHDSDTCMRLLVNSLEGRAAAEFFDLPNKDFQPGSNLAIGSNLPLVRVAFRSSNLDLYLCMRAELWSETYALLELNARSSRDIYSDHPSKAFPGHPHSYKLPELPTAQI